MQKAGWFVLAAAGLALFGTGTATAGAQHFNKSLYSALYQTSVATADGHGTFPIGHDHHYGEFSFTVTQGHNGPEGTFEFNEKNLQAQNVQHFLVHPIDQLSIAGHTAHFEGALLWHGRHARVRVIATDDGEHHDSISVRVVATDGPDAGTVLYEVSGVLTSGGIHVHAS